MPTENLTREETAARADAITLKSIRVQLDLLSAIDPERTGFSTITTLEFAASDPTTWVDFIGESVGRVTVNGEDREVQWDGARIALENLAATNTVCIEAIGAYSRSGEGMHRFVDPVDGETYLYTQYEPADSRRVMACFEQPDLKAAYTFEVTAPAHWHVLSNQSPTRTEIAGTTQTVVFAATLPISSYITAVAAGPYTRFDDEYVGESQTIALGLYCRQSLAKHLEHDEIFTVTKQGLEFFSTAFAYPYPWGKYDQIFVPEYNLGAMENPGLVTFTESYISRGAATDAQRGARANTILHEMAHMWFGDLVTMRWWDDLWLKESFADYMGAHVSAAATRFTDAWARFANSRKAWAYRQDQLPTTHPIVADIPDLEAAKLNFDGITYAKGASVLKQLVAFVGADTFFAGSQRYFAEHAFGNTTLADLLAVLHVVSGRDLNAWSAAWLETSGVSTLSLESDASGNRFIVQDSGAVAPRPHRLRVGLYDLVAGRLQRREQIELDVIADRTPIAFAPADLVLINDDDLTYAKARLDDASLRTVTRALSTLDDDLARGLVWSSLFNATRDGELAAAHYLDIVRRHAPHETNASLLAATLANAAYTISHYVAEEDVPSERAAWLEATHEALQGATPGSDSQLSLARAFASAAAFDGAHATTVRALLDGDAPAGLVVDADLRWQMLAALATTGHADTAEISAEHERDRTATGRTAEIRALASRPSADVRAEAWHSAWNDTTLTNDHLDATIAGIRAGGRRDLIDRFDAEYFERILPAWHERSIELAQRLVVGLFPASDSLEPVDTWLAQNADAPAALRRLILEQRDDLQRDARVRSVQATLNGPDAQP